MSDNITVPDNVRWVLGYFYSLDQENDFKAAREKYRNLIKPYLIDNFEPDERGNYLWEFEAPIAAPDGARYKGIMARRSVSEYTDEDKAIELIRKYGLEDRCLNEITSVEIDMAELLAANEEGIISDDEIDSLIEIQESYSLIRVKE